MSREASYICKYCGGTYKGSSAFGSQSAARQLLDIGVVLFAGMKNLAASGGVNLFKENSIEFTTCPHCNGRHTTCPNCDDNVRTSLGNCFAEIECLKCGYRFISQ
ncbi:MAG: hypothetical protein DPW18_06980 [Chloroflexi bacterium]|nr:hypothetical protein [Chloroflexota bacterium]